MTKLTKCERAVERAVLALLRTGATGADLEALSNQVSDMARRADYGWWDLVGAPHFTNRMKRIRERLEDGLS